MEDLHQRNQHVYPTGSAVPSLVHQIIYKVLAIKQGWSSIHNIPHGLLKNTHLEQSHRRWTWTVVCRLNGPHKGPNLVSNAYIVHFQTKSTPILFVGKVPSQYHTNTLPKFQTTKYMNCYNRRMHWSWALCGMKITPLFFWKPKRSDVLLSLPKCGGIPEIVESGVDGILYAMGNENALT